MKTIYTGKTKNLLEDEQGNIHMFFKDDVTGKDGVFDPGANHVGLSIDGSGLANLIVTIHFFELLKEKGIKTHYVKSNIDEKTMQVEKAKVFGKGLEVILRYRAVGSFLRRYGDYVEEGAPLDHFVEFTLKDDDREDPPITKDGLVMLGIMTADEYEQIVALEKKIGDVVKEDLASKGLDLYDIKFEFGKLVSTGEVVLIDEIAGGNMRVYKDGEYVSPLEIVNYYK